jgi:integrase/recombinase XerD
MITLRDYLLKNKTEQTVKVYLFEIEKYIEKNPESKEYKYKEILTFINSLREKYDNISTIHRILQSIKKYYDYLVFIKYRNDNPSRNIRLRDNKTRYIQLQDLLSETQLNSLLEQREERYKILKTRNQIIISLLVNQGLKASEIISIEINNIDLEKGTIYIKGNSKTNSRTLNLQANQVLSIYKYIKEERTQLIKQETEKLIIGKLGNSITVDEIHYLISTLQSRVTEKKVNPKTIRMSVIKLLLDKGNDMRMVQYFAGHKQADSTEKYKQTAVNTLQENINKYHTIQ